MSVLACIWVENGQSVYWRWKETHICGRIYVTLTINFLSYIRPLFLVNKNIFAVLIHNFGLNVEDSLYLVESILSIIIELPSSKTCFEYPKCWNWPICQNILASVCKLCVKYVKVCEDVHDNVWNQGIFMSSPRLFPR